MQMAIMSRIDHFRCPWTRSSLGVRRVAPTIAVVFTALLLAPVLAAGPPVSRAVLEQKVRLLENYLTSAMVIRIETANDLQAKRELEQAKNMFAEAHAALANGDLERAAGGLDEALRKLSSATAAVARTCPVKTKVNYDRLRGQVKSYINALNRDVPSSADDTGAKGIQARLDRMLGQAGGHAQAGRHLLAQKILTEAYRVAVVAIAARRKGETSVFRLTFETPADEYLYERKRNESYEVLVEIMMNEREAAASGLKAMVDRLTGESRNMRDKADAAAEAGDYPAAISAMEDATRNLVRALRAGGLPVLE